MASGKVIPWAFASAGVLTLDKILGRSPSNPKDYAAVAFLYLALLLMPDEVAVPMGISIFIAILFSHNDFLTKLGSSTAGQNAQLLPQISGSPNPIAPGYPAIIPGTTLA